MSNWPKYKSHKLVRAAKIVRIDEGPPRAIFVDRGDGVEQRFHPTVPAMAVKAEVGGYAVAYLGADHYTSVSPADAFEDGYTPVP